MTQSSESAQESHGPDEPGLVTNRTMEMVVAGIIIALAAVVTWSNYELGAGWTDDGPQAGYFPMWIGIIVLVCSGITFIQAAVKGSGQGFVTGQQLRQVCMVLLPLVAYVAVIGWLGIYVASILFIGGFMIFVGRFAWWKAILFSVGVMMLFFWVFEIQFRVPLPKGPLEMALGF